MHVFAACIENSFKSKNTHSHVHTRTHTHKLTLRCSCPLLISLRLSANRTSRAPMYSVLSSGLRSREVKLNTPAGENLLAGLSSVSEDKDKGETEMKRF